MTEKPTKLTVDKEARADLSAPERRAPFDTLRHEIDRLFEEFTPSFWRRPSATARAMTQGLGDWPMTPAIDLCERDGAYDITAELPGIPADAIEVRLSGGMLTIRGEKKDDSEAEETGYHISERRYGAFQRSFSLPDSIDADKIEAVFTNGVLKITLPKTEKARASEKRIEIRAA